MAHGRSCFPPPSRKACAARSTATLAGQAQKEFFVNQALGILDALQRAAVLASQPAPPAHAEDGDCYRITAPAQSEWAGCEDQLAVRIGGAWHLIQPRDGMRLLDSTAGDWLFYRAGWHSNQAPALPVGGGVVDNEARIAVEQLILALQTVGVLAPTTS